LTIFLDGSGGTVHALCMTLTQAIATEYRGEIALHTQDRGREPAIFVDADVERAFDETFDTRECEGHDSVTAGDYDTYPHTVYCDGSCIRARWGRD